MVVVGALVVVGLFVCLARRNLFRCVRLLILDGLEVPDALLSVVLVGFVRIMDVLVCFTTGLEAACDFVF